MRSFKSFITEDKNLHMTHAEDAVIDGGIKGTRNVINYLRDIRDMLGGSTKSSVNISVKWDGAPAVFAGTDPSDGKFFVAKKGVFNKNPKVYKTHADIDADTVGKGDLNSKLKVALDEFSKLGIKGVVQGDFLYERSDIKEETIDGESHLTFHPNTIVYAIPEKSRLASEILRSEIGVVWHTNYRGKSFESMSASFGEKIASNLKGSRSVWSVDAVYKDVTGQATMTKTETDAVTLLLSAAGKQFNKINKATFDGITENEDLLVRVKTYVNVQVRAGQKIDSPSKFVSGLMEYIYEYYQKEIDKRKSEKGKASQEEKRKEIMSYFSNTDKSQIVGLFELYNLIVDAKLMIIRKLDKAKTVGTFLKTKDGYKVTEQEGFVAIDRMGKNAVKLVDRLQFSNANFSPDYIKGWQK